MHKLSLTLAVYCITTAAIAQSFDYSTTIRWSDIPEKHVINPAFVGEAAVGILDYRIILYKSDGEELGMYTSYHKVIRINNDKGIEMFNKVYVPLYAGAELSDLKARVILKNGQVINVPADKVKEIEEDGRRYKLFAMEGVEKGAEIEYAYTIKRGTSYFGTEMYQSAGVPYQQVVFKLIVPKYLKFDAKAFNGFKLSTDSIINEQRVIAGYDENVVVLEDEKYAEKEAYLKRVEYKLSYNLSSTPDVRLFTWKEFAKRTFNNFTTLQPKDEKPLNVFIAKMPVKPAMGEEEKIKVIEHFIKTNINVDKKLIGEDAGAIEQIMRTKNTDDNGIIHLYAGVFEKLGINYQIVFTGRRDSYPIDEALENWNRIEETIFYFPPTNKYLAPASVELRYPYIPAYFADTKGLFLKSTTIGDFKTAIGVFKKVEIIPFEHHAHNMDVTIKFNRSMDTLLLNSRQYLMGYSATELRPIYAFLPKDKQDEANISIVKSVANSTDITNIKVENVLLTDVEDSKPYTISADIKSTELLENAGNKILFKVGEVIGPQVEMYQEKPRQLPIELPYPHVLNRVIKMEIPEGYQVKNLNDININIEHKEEGLVTMGFVSSYEKEGNIVTIKIFETYRNTSYPLSQFEIFKKVINASADFNKVVLVLEKM